MSMTDDSTRGEFDTERRKQEAAGTVRYFHGPDAGQESYWREVGPVPPADCEETRVLTELALAIVRRLSKGPADPEGRREPAPDDIYPVY